MARWRLQLLGEMGVGWRVRTQAHADEAAVAELKRAVGGVNGHR